MLIRLISILCTLLFVSGLKAQEKAELPVPTEVQMAWQEAELGVLFSFDLHTFTPGEWWPSRGDAPIEDIDVFNPEQLDTDQWIRAARDMEVKPNQIYYYKVCAVDKSGQKGAFSEEVFVKTKKPRLTE